MKHGNKYQPGSQKDLEEEKALVPVPLTASPFDQTGSFLRVGILLILLLLVGLLLLWQVAVKKVHSWREA